MINEQTIEKIFKNVSIPNQLGCDEFEDYGGTVDIFASQFDAGIEFYNGVSKCALVLKDEDEVIKVPFSGFFTEEDEEEFYEFQFADDLDGQTGSNWNYCENELQKYLNAVQSGFKEFFAATRRVTFIEGAPIYAQEKCVAIAWGGTSKTDISEKSKNIYHSNDSYDYDRLDKYWVCAAIDWYGAERVLEFIDYLRENYITDLHSGNAGFSTVDGRPVLIDWAGWREH